MGRWKGGLRRRGYIYTHIAQKLTQHCKAMILHLKKKKKNLPVMQETRVLSLDQEEPLESEMITDSSILVWRIPWAEEAGRLQSMGPQRVGHD